MRQGGKAWNEERNVVDLTVCVCVLNSHTREKASSPGRKGSNTFIIHTSGP